MHAANIEGNIFTDDKKSAIAATVVLMSLPDSAIIQRTVSDSAGRFVFENISPSMYHLLITLLGFEDYKTGEIIIREQQGTIRLEPVRLVPSVKSLTGVTVTGRKPLVEHRLDRTIVNVNALISATGLSAFEMLEKSPGVIVSQNNTISYMGKSGVLVLIDGKPTYLSGDNLASYLKSLPASVIDQIELMSNPPSKYEAGGTAGVINIRTKRTKTKGFTGSISNSFGITNRWRTNHSINFSYLSGKVALFINGGYGYQESKRNLTLTRSYFNTSHELVSSYEQQAYFVSANHSANIKAGLDFFLNSKTTIGLSVTGSASPGTYHNPVKTSIFNGYHVPDSFIIAGNTANSRFDNSGINMSYLKRLDSLGGTLEVNLDYVRYKARDNQTFENKVYDRNENFKLAEVVSSHLPATINIYAAKADYSKPFSNKVKLEAGAKVSYVNTDNAANYFKLADGISTPDYDNTNRFFYKENINASYLTISKELRRFSLQAGLRAENTNAEGLQAGNITKPDSSFERHYTNVFPTGYVQVKLDSSGKNLLNFSYSRRIDRPYYKDLNPFVYIIDKYTRFSGNPFLKPQLASNWEASYGYNNIVWITAFYNHYKNFQTETVKQSGDVFISTTSNIGIKTTTGINATVNLKPVKWWEINFYTELVHFTFKGEVNNNRLNTASTYYYFESGNQFALGKGWSAELSGFYISSRVVSQFRLDAKSQVSIGIQKKVWKGKGAVRVSASDIFKANISGGSILHIPNVASSYRNYFDTRMLMLGFSYSFSKGSAPKKRNTESSQDERRRVKN